MRCPLLVSERMLSRAKLSEVLSQLVVVLGDLARRANTLWSTTRLVERGGRRELDQMDFIAVELLWWKFRRDPRWMYLRRGWKVMSRRRWNASGAGPGR